MLSVKRPVRSLLWLTLAVGIVGGGLFAYIYFVVMNRALAHGEAFRFRRMRVARLTDQHTFRFFYITNRNSVSADDKLDSFGNQREDALTFGSFDAFIEPTLGLGTLVDPADWLQPKEIQIRSLDQLAEADFAEQLGGFVDKSPHRAVLVVIQGYREMFPTALRKAAFVSHVLDIDVPVLAFDWPGDQGNSLRGYGRAREVANASGGQLARVLEVLVEDAGPLTARLMASTSLPFRLALVTNESRDSNAVVVQRKARLSAEISTEELDLSWPSGVISLSHVALPFPPDDPLYGRREFTPDDALNLGQLEIQGERDLLKFPADWLLRLRYNPFYDFLESRALQWLDDSDGD